MFGTVTGDREKNWPMIADQRLDQRVPRNDPRNNCETHFGPSPRLVSKVDKGRSREKSYNILGGGVEEGGAGAATLANSKGFALSLVLKVRISEIRNGLYSFIFFVHHWIILKQSHMVKMKAHTS